VEVFFTTPRPDGRPAAGRDGLDEQLIRLLRSARRSIDMAIYDLELPAVAAALLDAHGRGLRVRVVTDTDNLKNEAIESLKAADIPVVDDRRGPIMHHKFVIVDGEIVWTGSWNFTPNETHRNDNNATLWRDGRLAENYAAEFEQLFGGRFGANKARLVPHPVIQAGPARVETFFSPQRDPTPAVIARLRGAQRTVALLAFSFTHDEIGAALLDRHRRGIQVRGVVETTGAEARASQYGPLRAAGVDLVKDANQYAMHHKVIVIDERTVVLGSFNFTVSAADENDENCLIVDDPALARRFLDEFERVRTLALARR
jgi:phosphatidylserine/phosphatidylglycerophosphate/cardiolipin synthase-like enzyme